MIESISKSIPIASVAVMDGDRILMGKRNDSGKYTLPGGHVEKGESFLEGAARELHEETGIKINKKLLKFLGSKEVVNELGKKINVHSYLLKTHSGTTTKEDPDGEVTRWNYIGTSDGLPKHVLENLHAPRNVTLNLLGLQEWGLKKIEKSMHQTNIFGEKPKLSDIGGKEGPKLSNIGGGMKQTSMFSNIGQVPEVEDIKINPKDISVKGGKYVHSQPGMQKHLETTLHDFKTHSGLSKSPEHKELATHLQGISGDSMREHFNNTTGRYKSYNEKPYHLRPTGKEHTMIDHRPLKDDDWTASDLSDEHKEEMDRFSSGKEFHEAVEKGDVSHGLKKFLQGYEATHYNRTIKDEAGVQKERLRRMYDNGEWVKGKKGGKSPLETFWEHPVNSNKRYTQNPEKDKTEYHQTNLAGEEHDDSYESEHKRRTELDYSHVPTETKKYNLGEEFEFAGQKHNVISDYPVVVKAKGEDGIVRDIKKHDITELKHEIPDIDIHSKKFHNTLRGREKDQYDDLYLKGDVPGEVKKHLTSMGFSDDEISVIHDHINTIPPSKTKISKESAANRKKEMEKANNEMSSFISDEGRKKIAEIGEKPEYEDIEPGDDKEYQESKEKYESVMNKHKDRLKEHLFGGKHHQYGEQVSVHAQDNIHKYLTPNRHNIESLNIPRQSEVTWNEIAKKMGLEKNNYAKGEIENTLKQMAQDGKVVVIPDKTLKFMFKSFAQLGNYIKRNFAKLKLFGMSNKNLTLEEFKKSINALGVRETWEYTEKFEEGVSQHADIVINYLGKEYNDPAVSIVKSLKGEAIKYTETAKHKHDLMLQYTEEEIEKALPTLLFQTDENGKIVSWREV